jgi:hypothetical protein
MLQTVSQLLPELPLILMTAVATHLVMSFAQTLMHYKFGHHPMGGKFFRNHINFHHAHYSKDHLVSRTYLGDEPMCSTVPSKHLLPTANGSPTSRMSGRRKAGSMWPLLLISSPDVLSAGR